MASVGHRKADAVLLGVCAEFARWSDVDPLLCRVTAALVCIFFAPVAIPGYVLAAAMLKSQARGQGTTTGRAGRAVADRIRRYPRHWSEADV